MTKHNKFNRFCLKLRAMMRFADELEALATDPKIRTACVVAPLDMSCVLSIGYNGYPAGVPHDAVVIEGRNTDGGSGMCHAELNALTKMDTRSCPPFFMYSTLSPCMRCAGQIMNTQKCKLLVYDRDYELDAGAGREFIERYCDTYVVKRKVVEWCCDRPDVRGEADLVPTVSPSLRRAVSLLRSAML